MEPPRSSAAPPDARPDERLDAGPRSAADPQADDPILAPLNGPQRHAATCLEGPLLVVAGPGSGKTRVITHRIAHMVRRGVPADAILAITFTNKAAGEMRSRLEELLGMPMPWISTFHSFAARLLRRHIYRLAPFTTAFSIYDADDSLSLVKECVKSLDYSTSIITPKALRAEISRLKNKGVEDPQVLPQTARLRDRVVRQVFSRYTRLLEERNALDFDDLLLFLVRLLTTQEDILEYYRDQFRYVLIDEYQDTNEVQYRIGNLIAQKHRNICATGDPDQSIYSWRGADIRNILSFERDYGDARVIKLEQNYRSTKAILAAANALIAHNEDRKEKVLWTENAQGDPVRVYRFTDGDEEAGEVATLIEQFRQDGVRGDDIAVFYRINAMSRELEQALVLRGIPYTIVGAVEFFQRREVKDVLAYLRILSNPRDTESFRRIVNVPARGLGKTTVERLLEAASADGTTALALALDPEARPSLTARAERALDRFGSLYTALSEMPRTPVATLMRAVLSETGYEDSLERLDPEEAEDRRANVHELINAASQYDMRQPDGTLEGFLHEISLFAAVDRWEEREDQVTLMTLHSAKGLEFPIVIILGVEEGLLPLLRSDPDGDPPDFEEERRLMFVGMTRARSKLYLTHAARRFRFGRYLPNEPSMFLLELAGSDDEATVAFDADTRGALMQRCRSVDAFDWDEELPRAHVAAGGESGDDDEPFSVDDWDDDVVDEDPYPIGARVVHEHYGEGVVTDSRGHGRLRRLTVRFEEAGEKQLVIAYAELRRL